MTSVGRTMMSTTLSFAVVFVVLVSPLHVVAQEPSPPPAYLFVIESKIASEDAGDWANAVSAMAQSHAKHPDGNSWATYSKLTGGPDETVRTFFPLDKMGNLDEWPNNRRIVTEVMGKDSARVILSDLELAGESSERILSWSEKLSHPDVQFRPAPYAWVVEVQVAEGQMTEYAALAQRLVEILKENRAGTWMVYGSALGGDRSTLYYFYLFDKFADVDGWPSRLDVASESLGAAEAARLLAALEAVSQTTTSLWQLEPELSQRETR